MNPCTHDTRVMKEATSLSSNGYEVHIVALLKGDVQSEECVDGITIHRVKPALIRPIRLLSVLLLYIPYCTRIPSARVREKGEESPNATVNAFGWIYCFLKRVPALVALGVKQTFAFLIQIGELVFRGIWYLVVLVATCIVAPFQFVFWLLKNRIGTRYKATVKQRVEPFLVFQKKTCRAFFGFQKKKCDTKCDTTICTDGQNT